MVGGGGGVREVHEKKEPHTLLLFSQLQSSNMSEKTSVLFVCLGNICRSPMAEAVFKKVVDDHGLGPRFTIDSCGTAGYHIGDDPDSRTVSTCRSHGVPIRHLGRQLSKADFNRFDFILGMDEQNLRDIQKAKPSDSKAVIKLFGTFDSKGETIIHDPYYSGMESFEKGLPSSNNLLASPT